METVEDEPVAPVAPGSIPDAEALVDGGGADQTSEAVASVQEPHCLLLALGGRNDSGTWSER